MMFSACIPLKPVNVNRLRLPIGGRLISSPEARRFKKEVRAYVENTPDLKSFQKRFNAQKSLSVTYRFYVPLELYYKKGTKQISNRAGDVTNFIKATQDAVFDVLDIPDRYITECHVYKEPAEDWAIRVDIVQEDNYGTVYH